MNNFTRTNNDLIKSINQQQATSFYLLTIKQNNFKIYILDTKHLNYYHYNPENQLNKLNV